MPNAKHLTRLERLEKLQEQREQEAAEKRLTSTDVGFKPEFPTADKWDEFAPLTWIRTSGSVKPFQPSTSRRS